MSLDDKYTRWKELFVYVSNNTAQNYVDTFVKESRNAHEDHTHTISALIPLLSSQLVVRAYAKAAGRRLFVCCY